MGKGDRLTPGGFAGTGGNHDGRSGRGKSGDKEVALRDCRREVEAGRGMPILRSAAVGFRWCKNRLPGEG